MSSLALPVFIDVLDSSKVDEIKALLNSAAADCLQNKRSQDKPVVDDEIISDKIIETIGYQIDQERSLLTNTGTPECALLWLKPIKGDKNDSVRYNIGFQLLDDGKLDKLAETEADSKKSDCENWAGKCEFSAEAKELADYKNEIRAAKEDCDSALENWKKSMSPKEFQQWDSSKGPDTCPLTPPEDGEQYKGTKECTTQGCDLPIWGLWDSKEQTGTTYNSESAYLAAREILIGQNCADQIKEEFEDKKFTNPSSAGWPLSECEDEEYWFIEGKDMGSEIEWRKGMCDQNKQKLLDTIHSDSVEYCDTSPIYICGGEEKTGSNAEADFEKCLANNKDAQCTQALNNDAISQNSAGPHTSPTPDGMTAPIGADCGEEYYYCKKSGKIYRNPDAKEKYDADEQCQITTGGPGCIPSNEYYCNILPGSEYCECIN